MHNGEDDKKNEQGRSASETAIDDVVFCKGLIPVVLVPKERCLVRPARYIKTRCKLEQLTFILPNTLSSHVSDGCPRRSTQWHPCT